MNKKTMSLIGMIVGLVVAVCGVAVMLGAFGGDASYANSPSSSYDSGYATFGADFYTIVTNNAGAAASAASTTAANLVDIAELLKNACGLLLIAIGALGFCSFGVSFSEAKAAEDAKKNAEASEPSVVEPIAAAAEETAPTAAPAE